LFNSLSILNCVWVLKGQGKISAAFVSLASQKVLAATWKHTLNLKGKTNELSDQGKNSN